MWTLRVVKGAEAAEKLVTEMRLPPAPQRFGIGREPANQWVLEDRARAVSGRHCEIEHSADGPLLRDLSTNGSFVNGAATRLLGTHLLRDGDRIELGPFVIEVSGPPMPARPPASEPAPRTVAPLKQPSVMGTAPLRGGDPAAMLAQGGAADMGGLTEILRAVKSNDDSSSELTKIRMASAPAAPVAPRAGQASAPAKVVTGEQAAARAHPPANLTDALALGLGVDAAALTGLDPLRLAQSLACAARGGVWALRQLLDQQAQSRRALGSRPSVSGALRGSSPLRAAPSAEAALLSLAQSGTDPAPLLQASAAELCAHQARLMQAFGDAARRMGEQLAPEALQTAQQAQGSATPAQLWALYARLWADLGLAPGQGWPAGFQEAAMQHLAAAYDAAQT